MDITAKVEVFDSFEQENEAEHRRLYRMSPDERWHEFALLQARRWGDGWTSVPIVKKVTFEKVRW